MAKRVSMDDIASAVGVSRNTVWLALKGKSGVSEQTREEIRRAAEFLGYHRLRDGKVVNGVTARRIGLLAGENIFRENVFFGPIMMHIQQHASLSDATLTVHAVTKEEEENRTLPQFVMEKSVEGLIVLSRLNNGFIHEAAGRLPVVLVDHQHPLLPYDSVGTANIQGAYVAAEFLAELGFHEIGFMGNIHAAYSYRQRWQGFKLALEEANLPIQSDWQWLSSDEALDSILRFVQGLPRLPQAWFCVNDALAFYLVQALESLGMSVPTDCAVVGFDNQYFSEICNPTLTTMSIDLEYFGRRSVERLFQRITNPGLAPEYIEILPTLKIRESTPVKTIVATAK